MYFFWRASRSGYHFLCVIHWDILSGYPVNSIIRPGISIGYTFKNMHNQVMLNGNCSDVDKCVALWRHL